jgi:hypothetical protein
MSGARQLAVRGVGYAALVLALHGFGPSVEKQLFDSSGGAYGKTKQPPAELTAEQLARAAVRDEALRKRGIAVPTQSAPKTEAAPEHQPLISAKTAAIQAQPVASAPPSIVSIQQSAGQDLAIAQLAAREALASIQAEEQAAIEQLRSNRNRAAILVALLLSQQ